MLHIQGDSGYIIGLVCWEYHEFRTGWIYMSEMRLLGDQAECRDESNELGLRGLQRTCLTRRLSSRYANYEKDVGFDSRTLPSLKWCTEIKVKHNVEENVCKI